jgi:hypothetical protein
MKIISHFTVATTCALALLVFGTASVHSAPPASKASPGASPSEDVAVPRSVFTVPAKPEEGRDPFFPSAHYLFGRPVQSQPTAPPTTRFVLQGLSGTSDQRLAIINGRTMAEGEEAEVNHQHIRCIEIKEDSVIIEVAGARQELRLRADN